MDLTKKEMKQVGGKVMNKRTFHNLWRNLQCQLISGQDFEAFILLRGADELRKVFEILPTLSEERIKKVIQILTIGMKSYAHLHYIHIYRHFRNYKGNNWYNIYTPEVVRKLCTEDLTIEEKITFLGLVTFHPNGYCREEALKRLILIGYHESLKFILMRCNDHVENIRELALIYIKDRVEKEQIEDISRYIAWINHMPMYKKAYTNELYGCIYEKLETRG